MTAVRIRITLRKMAKKNQPVRTNVIDSIRGYPLTDLHVNRGATLSYT